MTSFSIHIYTRAHTHTVLLQKDKVSQPLFSTIFRVIYPFFCISLTLPILVKMFWWIFPICSLISLRFYYPPLYASLPFQNSFSLSWLLCDFTLYSSIYLKTENWDSQVRAAPLSFWVRVYLSVYFLGPSIYLKMSLFYFSLQVNIIPLYVYTTFSLSILWWPSQDPTPIESHKQLMSAKRGFSLLEG